MDSIVVMGQTSQEGVYGEHVVTSLCFLETSQKCVEYAISDSFFPFLKAASEHGPLDLLLLVMNLVVNCSDSSLKLSIFPRGIYEYHFNVVSPKLVGNILHMANSFESQKVMTCL